MDINILTQPLFCNYGGILQNYALQEVLRCMGHEPLTINIPKGAAVKGNAAMDFARACRNFYHKTIGRYSAPYLSPYKLAVKERELSVPQREFIKKHINKVDAIAPYTAQTASEHPADAWIVGSDQVWRPWCSPYIANCFFDFVDDRTPKIAYGASFGTDQWEIDPDTTAVVAGLAKRFKAISVREASGIKLCKEHLGVEATHVLDPTMLLSAKDYLMLTADNDHPEGEYIATYILDPDPGKAQAAKVAAKGLALPLKAVGRMHRERFDSIESWLATIAHAEYIITDSFHGTAFSIIFNRPVMVLGNSLRGNTRIASLVEMLQLEQSPDGFYRPDVLSANQMKLMRTKSLKFISDALSI